MDNKKLAEKIWDMAGEMKAISANLEADTIRKDRAAYKLAKLQEEMLRIYYNMKNKKGETKENG